MNKTVPTVQDSAVRAAQPSDPRRVDRRIQRTRQLLRDALMTLVVQRGEWDSIAIQDITDQANVSRTTFYLHFRDKEDLLFTSMQDMYDSLVEAFEPVAVDKAADPETIDFDHVAQYADFYRVMLGPKGSGAFVERVHNYLAGVIIRHVIDPLRPHMTAPPATPPEMIAHFLAGAEIGAIRWWLATGMQQTPLEMARALNEVCVRGAFEMLELPRPTH